MILTTRAIFFKTSLLILLTSFAQVTTAAQISARVYIDSIRITPIDTGEGLPEISWDGQVDIANMGRTVDSYVENSFDDSVTASKVENWTQGASVIKQQPGFSVSASTSAEKLEVIASIDQMPSIYIEPGTNQILFLSNALRRGGFNVDVNGRIRVDANYHIEANIGATPGLVLGIGAYVFPTDNWIGFTLRPGDGPFSYSNSFSVESDVTNQNINFFDLVAGLSVTGTTPVPIPSSFWLFGSLLICTISRKLLSYKLF